MVLAYPSSFHFDKRYHEKTGEWIEDEDLKGKKDGPGRIPNSFMPSAHVRSMRSDASGRVQFSLPYPALMYQIFYGQRVMEIPDGVPKWESHKGHSVSARHLESDRGSGRPRAVHN